jgi:DNA-binding MarR family transcriptional regulator
MHLPGIRRPVMLHSVTTRAVGGGAESVVDPHRTAVSVHDLLASFIRLTPRDLNLTALSALSTLERKGPRRITELAASEGVTQPTVTSLVASLVRAGYVERRSDPADKRVVMVALTDAGVAYIRRRRADNAQIIAGVLGQLSADELAALAAALPVIERLQQLADDRRVAGR